MGSHSVTCHLTQVNAPRLNPSQIGRYLIYLPWMDGRLCWPRWLVKYWDSLPARRQSPIPVLIGPVDRIKRVTAKPGHQPWNAWPRPWRVPHIIRRVHGNRSAVLSILRVISVQACTMFTSLLDYIEQIRLYTELCCKTADVWSVRNLHRMSHVYPIHMLGDRWRSGT